MSKSRNNALVTLDQTAQPAHRRFFAMFVFCVLTIAAPCAAQRQSVIDSPHNLSAAGPGAVRASSEDQVCIFCHTPHNASPIRPLWNRTMPTSSYTVYTSRSLDAHPGQPTGASKLCLSCHDGTIAVGSVFSRDQVIQMVGGVTVLPPGASNLDTDLSDDHPISFQYDSGLWQQDPQLADPHSLPTSLKLDANQELQCTTCHDAHNNVFGDFLVMNNLESAMCVSCHKISHNTVPSHDGCTACHQTHSAPSGPYLLKQAQITTTCTSCHDGTRPRAANILAELNRLSVHDTDSPVDPPEPIVGHATCADCHEPHSMDQGSAIAPQIQPRLGRINGVNGSGAPVAVAQNEFEVCYKCHADQNAITQPTINRQIVQINTRMQFDPGAISSHPVQAPGHSTDVPSLKPGWTTASIVYCSDCHNSNTSQKAGGTGPNGVHGSNEQPLLIARYLTEDYTSESASSYALCYTCHYRDGSNGILSDRSFELHKKHIVDERTPCSACHDAHGISSAQGSSMRNSHLINFDTSIVIPEPRTGRLRFTDLGTNAGSCTLTCHGKVHDNLEYR